MCHFPSDFCNKTHYSTLLSPIHATCLAHLIILDLPTWVFAEEYKPWSLSLCSLFYSSFINMEDNTDLWLVNSVIFYKNLLRTFASRFFLNCGNKRYHVCSTLTYLLDSCSVCSSRHFFLFSRYEVGARPTHVTHFVRPLPVPQTLQTMTQILGKHSFTLSVNKVNHVADSWL